MLLEIRNKLKSNTDVERFLAYEKLSSKTIYKIIFGSMDKLRVKIKNSSFILEKIRDVKFKVSTIYYLLMVHYADDSFILKNISSRDKIGNAR